MQVRERSGELDLLLVTHAANIFYLTGFRGSAGMLLVGPGEATLIVDARYVTVARRVLDDASAPGEPVVLAEVESSYEETLCELLRARGTCRLGIESDHMTVARHEWIERPWPARGRAAPHVGAGRGGPAVRTPGRWRPCARPVAASRR